MEFRQWKNRMVGREKMAVGEGSVEAKKMTVWIRKRF